MSTARRRRSTAAFLVVSLAGLGALVGPLACGSDDSGGGAVPVGSACSAFVAQVCPTQAQACQADGACTACESDVTQSACHFGVFAQVAACACATTGSACQTECAAYAAPTANGGSGPGAGGSGPTFGGFGQGFGGSGPTFGGFGSGEGGFGSGEGGSGIGFGGFGTGEGGSTGSVVDHCYPYPDTTEACATLHACMTSGCGTLTATCDATCTPYFECVASAGCAEGPSACGGEISSGCQSCIANYATCVQSACASFVGPCQDSTQSGGDDGSSDDASGDDGGVVDGNYCDYIIAHCCPAYDEAMGNTQCHDSYTAVESNPSAQASCEQALPSFEQAGYCN